MSYNFYSGVLYEERGTFKKSLQGIFQSARGRHKLCAEKYATLCMYMIDNEHNKGVPLSSMWCRVLAKV